MKRFTSILLALMMVLSCMVVVSAEGTELVITKQPTADDMSVEVNLDSGVTYQWYEVDMESPVLTAIDDTIATTVENTPQLTGTSSYNEELGTWIPMSDGEYAEYFSIYLEAGDSITVEFSDDTVEGCGLGDYDSGKACHGISNEDGSYTISVDTGAFYVLFAYAAAPITTDTLRIAGDAPAAKAWLNDYACTAIEGETESTLSEYVLGKTYLCEVTAGETVVKSKRVKAALVITKQPTIGDPSVEVSLPDEVKSYQWQILGESSEQPITPDCASPADLGELFASISDIAPAGFFDQIQTLVPNSSYVEISDEISAWYPSVAKIEIPTPTVASASTYVSAPDSVYVAVYFSAYFEEGDVYVKFSDMSYIMNIILSNMDTMIEYEFEEDENGDLYTTVDEAGIYTLAVGSYVNPSEIGCMASGNVASFEDVEGETESTLTEMDLNNIYRCLITDKNDSALASYFFAADYRIISQPTAADPTLLVSFEDEAEFQWFIGTPVITPLDDTMVSNAVGTYDSETGIWTGEHGEPYSYSGYMEYISEYFDIYLEAGTLVNVTLTNPDAMSPSDPEMRFSGDSSTEYVEFDESGVGSVVITKSDTYNVYHYCIDPETTTVKFEISSYDFEPIEGETDKTLSSFEYGSVYGAEATYEDDTALVSDHFRMDYAITKQPTVEDPSVEVNFPEGVEAYQWFKVTVEDVIITDEYADPVYYDGETIGEPSYYDKENGYWVPSLYDEWEGTSDEMVPNRVYFVDTDWTNVNVFFWSDDNSELTSWPGEAMTYDEDNGIYYYDLPEEAEYVIFNNGTDQTADLELTEGFNIYSHSDSYWDEYYEIVPIYEYDIFTIELKKGDVISITPSTDVRNDRLWVIYDEAYDDSVSFKVVYEDGTFTLEAPFDGHYYFYVDSYEEDITFTASGTLTLYTILEDETESTLKAPAIGETYVCGVLFDDDTVMFSDTVTFEAPEYILGDVNADGAINQYDYILVKRHYFGTRYLTDDEMLPADANSDGEVNQFDYILIRRHYFGTYVIG